MANTFSLTVASSLSAQITGGATYPAVNSPSLLRPSDTSYTAGTAQGSVDQLYMAQVTATTGGVSIQLNAGGLLDPIGGSFAPARIQSLGFYNSGTANVAITGAFITGAFGASASIPIHPSGRAVFDYPSNAALAVSAGTNSTVTFTSASGTAPVQVLLGGRSV